MSNLFASSNSLVLIGVGILAVLVIFLAVWLARVNSRASKERAKVEALEQRLAHVEDYLSRTSQHEAPARPAEEPLESAKTRPVPARKAPARTKSAAPARQQDDAPEKARRSKKQPVIPYGQAKASADEVYGGGGVRSAAPAQRQAVSRSAEADRQSITRDARRRREERRQEQMRRQAQNIVQEMQQSSDTARVRPRPSASGPQRRVRP